MSERTDKQLVQEVAQVWAKRLSAEIAAAKLDSRSVNVRRDIRLLALRLSKTIAEEMKLPDLQPTIYETFKEMMELK